MKAYLQHKAGDNGPFLTESVEACARPLWWQEKGLSYTASGYGAKIPTRYCVKHGTRWKRVYCRIFSNVGTLYIIEKGERIIVSIEG